MSLRILVQFLTLFAFWLLLSWRFTPLFLVLGLLSAAGVTAVTHRLVAATLGPAVDLLGLPLRVGRFAVYAVWLAGRMLAGAMQVAYDILTPGMPSDPHLLRFDTTLASPIARTMLANSISVVPGTITLEVDESTFLVHAFVPRAADDLVSATLQNRIAVLFDQETQAPPEVVWDPPDDPLTGATA